MPLYPVRLDGCLAELAEVDEFVVESSAGNAGVWNPVLDRILENLERLVAIVHNERCIDRDSFEDHFQAWLHTYCLVAEYRYLNSNPLLQ